jgi:hypothetical protein
MLDVCSEHIKSLNSKIEKIKNSTEFYKSAKSTENRLGKTWDELVNHKFASLQLQTNIEAILSIWIIFNSLPNITLSI